MTSNLWLPLLIWSIQLQKLIKHLNISDEEVSSGITAINRLIGLHEDDFYPKLNS